VLCFAQRGGKGEGEGEGEGEGRTWWVPRRRRSAPPGERETWRQSSAGRPAGEGRGKDKKRETKREREGNRAERRNREREVGMAGWPGRALFFFLHFSPLYCM
jgi:hypothetical protein